VHLPRLSVLDAETEEAKVSVSVTSEVPVSALDCLLHQIKRMRMRIIRVSMHVLQSNVNKSMCECIQLNICEVQQIPAFINTQ